MPEWPRRPRKVDDARSSRFTIRRLRSRPVELTGKGLRHTFRRRSTLRSFRSHRCRSRSRLRAVDRCFAMITCSVEFRSESPPSRHRLSTTTLASHDRRLVSFRLNRRPPAHVGDQDCVQQYQTPDAVTIGDHGTAVQRRRDGDLLAVHDASDRHGQLDPEPPQPGCRRLRLLPQRAVATAPKLSGDDIKEGHGAVSLRHLFRLLRFIETFCRTHADVRSSYFVSFVYI